MNKQEAVLKNWEFVWLEGENANILLGNVFGHPRFREGHRIHTSAVVNFNLQYGIAETLHTFYRLEDYEYEEVAESSELERPTGEGSSVIPARVIALCKRK